MKEARLMPKNDTSIQNTAERLGFYDAFHFSKTVKRFRNQPPGSYRSA